MLALDGVLSGTPTEDEGWTESRSGARVGPLENRNCIVATGVQPFDDAPVGAQYAAVGIK
jgi:hypothetical protein